MVQGVQVTLKIPKSKAPICAAESTTSCSNDSQCCFNNTGYGTCMDSLCVKSAQVAPPTVHIRVNLQKMWWAPAHPIAIGCRDCKIPSAPCTYHSECCSQVCQFEWTESKLRGKGCELIPSLADATCINDSQCTSHQCCGNTNKICQGSICQKTIQVIEDAFNRMHPDSGIDGEDWKGDDNSFHIISILTIILVVVIEIGTCWYISRMKKLKATRAVAGRLRRR